MRGPKERDIHRHHRRQDVCAPWRIFCALDIPAEVSGALKNRVAQLHATFPQVRASWNRDGKFHITLKFIGDVPQQRVAVVAQAALRVTENFPSFDLAVAGAGAFPTQGSPRALWIGINDSEGKLSQLHKRLEVECGREGFEKEARKFQPHLTLARIRHAEGARSLAQFHVETPFNPIRFVVSELLVIRSELSPLGSRYTTVSQSQLRSG